MAGVMANLIAGLIASAWWGFTIHLVACERSRSRIQLSLVIWHRWQGHDSILRRTPRHRDIRHQWRGGVVLHLARAELCRTAPDAA
jgi:hypothetical protein